MAITDRRAGRTNWRRFLLVLTPSAGAAMLILHGIAQGAVPVSFTGATPFRVTVERLEATGFGFAPAVSPRTGAVGIRTSMPRADVTGMCQSQTVELPVVGTVTVKMTTRTVHATDLVIDAYSASGRLDLRQLVIGPTEGITGYHSDQALLENVTIEAGSATAGTFALDGVDLTIQPGDNPCPVLRP